MGAETGFNNELTEVGRGFQKVTEGCLMSRSWVGGFEERIRLKWWMPG